MKYKFWHFLTQFSFNNFTTGVKTASQKQKNHLRSNSSVQSSIKFWFWSFYHPWHMIYNFEAFFPQFRDNDVTKKINSQEFWKINSRSGFDLFKIQMLLVSVEVSIVVWSPYITLKLFWRTLENYIIKGHLFHIFGLAFYKKCNFRVLKEVFSICTNFHNDCWRTCPDIRNLVFLLNEE